MGDVLLTIPVLLGVLNKDQDLQLVFVTRKKFIPYFDGIDRLITIPFDPEGPHKGLAGLFRLFGEIRRHPFNQVVDLHGILRTWILDILFQFSGCRIYTVSKHRKKRREMLKHRLPGLRLPHATERYLEVFAKAGLAASISAGIFPAGNKSGLIHRIPENKIRIGIAPVSRHKTKNWGIGNTDQLISLLRLEYSAEIHLFGGREDRPSLNALTRPDVFNHAGVMGPLEEIAWIRSMNLFVSMDSANMHLAALCGIPTVSIWGATDPGLGFAPLNQPDDFALFSDPDQVYCRPCSIYGEIPCKRSDAPMICMNSISPTRVLDKINEILNFRGKI